MDLKRVKVVKDGITKEIYESDLPKYLAMGWIELKENIFNKI